MLPRLGIGTAPLGGLFTAVSEEDAAALEEPVPTELWQRLASAGFVPQSLD